MKIQKIFKMISRVLALGLFIYAYFMADPVFAAGITAEYKCTSDCSLCITFDGKKTVCSEKYPDDSEEYEKAKKLSRFVNEGLISPSSDIKQGFSLNAFANKFFNCEFMIKKAEQIKQAAENMCVRKTVKHETYMPRAMDEESTAPKSARKDRASETSERRPASKEKEKSSGTSLREQKKAASANKRAKREAESKEPDLAPPPTESMDDLIKQMDE